MSGFLAQFYDPALSVPTTETKVKFRKDELERLLKMHHLATAAAAMTRRLGGEADSAEMAIDRKRGRRIAHVAEQVIISWGDRVKRDKAAAVTGQEAAIVDWVHWWEEHQVWLVNRQRYLATWCSKTSTDERWCKSAMVRLMNEAQWLAYAFRD